MSLSSTTSAFNRGVDERDTFLGLPRCIICGSSVRQVLEHCHIVGDKVPEVWSELKLNGWFPPNAKNLPQHEPRDGLLMCNHHHALFDGYCFFIRFVPDIHKFVFINFSNLEELQPYHGKAVALDIRDRCAAFPSLFIIHEMRVRGFNPFEPLSLTISHDVSWQDWIVEDGVFDDTLGSFIRAPPPSNSNDNNGGSARAQLPATRAGGGSSVGLTVELNSDVIARLLSVTHAMPSWNACQMEGTGWTTTAEENIQKYGSMV